MKTLALSLALLYASTLVVPSFAAPAATENTTHITRFAISKMDCADCALVLNASLQKMKGVKSAKVDFKTKRATVAYDAGKTSDAKLLAFFKEAGFPAKVAK